MEPAPEKSNAPEAAQNPAAAPDLSQARLPQRQTVNYLGVELFKGEPGPAVPAFDRFRHDVRTNFELMLEQKIALAFLLNQPILVEGGSDLGKTQTVQRMCAELSLPCYYANCSEYDLEVLIGQPGTREDTRSGFGWNDGLVVQPIRYGGVLILDEFNFMRGAVRARLHEILDAYFNGRDHITLTENNGERVPLHAELRIIALQNPPGGDYSDRDILDKAQLSRFFYVKLPTEIPEELKRSRALGAIGRMPKIDCSGFLLQANGGFTREELKTVHGLPELLEQYLEFEADVQSMLRDGKLAADAYQPPYLSFNRDLKRLLDFTTAFYDGDILSTFRRGLELYYVSRFEYELDQLSVRALIDQLVIPDPLQVARQSLPPEKKTLE